MFDTLPTITISRDTLDAIRDLRVMHNINAEQYLTDVIAAEITQELDSQIIQDIISILDSPPTENITLVGGDRNLWLSEEEMADIRAWSGIDVDVVIRQEAYSRSLGQSLPNEKVNWMKEGF